MAENNNEISVITHLLQVEKDASILIDDACKEAEERISQARSKSNQEFKSKYDAVVSELEEQYNSNLNTLKQSYTEEVDNFKNTLESKPQNKQAFNNLLDKLLFSDAVK